MAVAVAPPQTETLVTGEEMLKMGDIGPCDLVEGRIVRRNYATMRHGACVSNFAVHLRIEKPSGQIAVGGVGVYTQRNPDTVRSADVVFISHEWLARVTNRQGYLDVAPEVVADVLLPEDSRDELQRKLREYFTVGVLLIFVADPESKTISAYRSLTDVRQLAEDDTLTADDVLPGFSVPVAALFEE